jgi:hypothetical protein
VAITRVMCDLPGLAQLLSDITFRHMILSC